MSKKKKAFNKLILILTDLFEFKLINQSIWNLIFRTANHDSLFCDFFSCLSITYMFVCINKCDQYNDTRYYKKKKRKRMIITLEEAILIRKNFEGARKQWIFTYCSGYQEKKKRKILFL